MFNVDERGCNDVSTTKRFFLGSHLHIMMNYEYRNIAKEHG